MKHKLYCFDFDGTLTTKDSMIELIRYAHGTKGLILGLLANIWYLVMMKLHLYPNWRSKERILAHFSMCCATTSQLFTKQISVRRL